MILRKDQLEASLQEEKKLIQNGRLKEDNPLDTSEPFRQLCMACRRGDLKVCQELVTAGVNINAQDAFDYTPLILASLCGHYEVVHLLLESGALCERDTFQGERCLYNALNDRIRNLLLSYDYSKSVDPLQPWAAHISSLLSKANPRTSDIVVTAADRTFNLHKFVLAARSSYFRKKLANNSTLLKLPSAIPPPSFDVALRFLYLGELPSDVGSGSKGSFSEAEILEGLNKISTNLEMSSLWEGILENEDRRLARQKRAEEVERGRKQMEFWFRENVLAHKIRLPSSRAADIKWDAENAIFADILLRADEPADESLPKVSSVPINPDSRSSGIPIGPCSDSTHSESMTELRYSCLFPAHRAMLLRSPYFHTMFSSSFLEAQPSRPLHIVTVDCSPAVLELVLTYMYAEKVDIPLSLATDVLFAADLLLMEPLKTKAAVAISTLANGSLSASPQNSTRTAPASETIDIAEILRTAWDLSVQRLETFAARYIAYRLELYIDDPEFAALVQESAARIKGREETDSIELIDDIKWYLSERYRLRFENTGINEMIEEDLLEKAATEDGSNAERDDPAVQASREHDPVTDDGLVGHVRTLDGDLVEDEFASEAIDYQILLRKIEHLLEKLQLEA